jgi:uncharacterized protein YkwD
VTLIKPNFANTVTDKVLGSLTEVGTTASMPLVVGDSVKSSEKPSLISYLRILKKTPTISTSAAEDTTATVDLTTLSTNNIVDATNRERIKAGLLPLTLNDKLVLSATIKTKDMIKKQYFEHISPTGEGVSDLGQKVGYNYIILGENLALGNFTNGDDVVQAWMNSPGHRANILNVNYEEIGVYAAKATYQGREVWFAVQHFGTARDACPAISTSLKTAIDTINSDLKSRQAHIADEKSILEGPNHPQGQEYKDKITAFNGLVAEYNTALVISQEKIKTYNIQVAAFNACLAQYQKK